MILIYVVVGTIIYACIGIGFTRAAVSKEASGVLLVGALITWPFVLLILIARTLFVLLFAIFQVPKIGAPASKAPDDRKNSN